MNAIPANDRRQAVAVLFETMRELLAAEYALTRTGYTSNGVTGIATARGGRRFSIMIREEK